MSSNLTAVTLEDYGSLWFEAFEDAFGTILRTFGATKAEMR